MALRTIDDDAGPGAHSRAMAVHARTLELYRQFGFADEIVAQRVKIAAIHLRESRDGVAPRELATIDLRELGDDSTPYPFILAYAQDDHERFLLRQLEDAGARVEWNTKIEDFTQDDTQVIATVGRAGGGHDEISAAYICGCDGPHSRVREVTGVGFPGGTYDQHFYVADVKTMQAMDNDLRMTLGKHTLARGDRLPWLGEGLDDNFAPLRSLDWQVHVYGDAARDVSAACAELHLPIHSFGWNDGARDRGFQRGALYLVRPDGYVALAASENAAEKLGAYVNRFSLSFP